MDIDEQAVRPPDRFKRRPVSLAVILCVLGTLGFGWVLWAVSPAMASLRSMHNPLHDHLAQNSSLPVVTSLLKPDTRFDVAFTVWARKANSDTSNPERYLSSNIAAVPTPLRAMVVGELTKHTVSDCLYMPEEEAVFSQIILEGVSLASKPREVTVNFDLPLERLYDLRLNPEDVRGVIALVPHTSLLGKVTNVSSHMPRSISIPPNFGKGLEATGRLGEPGSVEREAIEAMTISIPLLRTAQEMRDWNITGQATTIDNEPSTIQDKSSNFKTPKGRTIEEYLLPPLHPFLQTRLNVYLVNETRPLLEEQYLAAHEEAKSRACTNKQTGKIVHRLLCENEDYKTIGQWGTMLEVTDEGTSTRRYGPYLGHIKLGDYKSLRLPVQLPHTPKDNNGPLPESVNVQLTVAFMSSKPWHTATYDWPVITMSDEELHNATEMTHQMYKDQWALYHGLLIHPVDGTNPWARLVLGAIMYTSDIVLFLLTYLYWYTRQTVTGISIVGSSFAIIEWLTALGMVFASPMLYVQLCVLSPWTIAKEGSRWKIRKWRWTHRERATIRQDANWVFAVSLFFALCAVFWIGDTWNLRIIPSRMTHIDLHASELVPFGIHLMELMGHAAGVTTSIIQAIVNYRTGMFAGMYALAAYGNAINNIALLAYQTPIVGRYLANDGVSIRDLVPIITNLVMAYQAATLPRVDQNVPADEE